MIPESLVASMLPPAEFGKYLAVGTRKSAHGRAMFFELKDDFRSDEFDLDYAAQRCVAHADGRPKNSLYLSIYRALERVPLAAIDSLWLASEHGKSLELRPAAAPPDSTDAYYLYQEVCPVHPLIASKLGPRQFAEFITRPNKPLCVPKICFVDIDLGELATDPEHGTPRELYYPDHYWHLRGCLLELKASQTKDTKTVDRTHLQHFPYHCIKNGIFVGDQTGLLYYPFPKYGELIGKYYEWWHSTHH
jgi:hypothetical protein